MDCIGSCTLYTACGCVTFVVLPGDLHYSKLQHVVSPPPCFLGKVEPTDAFFIRLQFKLLPVGF